MDKNKNKNEEKKRKFRSLILLLFITIIMFGTSTYAWFTANRVVTISSINVNVQASNGIQISTDAVNWKSIITNDDITDNAYSGAPNYLPDVVTNVSSAGQVDTTNDIMKMFKSEITSSASDGSYVLTASQDSDASGHYVSFDIFLRVDTTSTIYLTTESDVVSLDNTDKGLKNASRVAFVYLGHGNSDDSSASLAALSLASVSNPPTTAIIWEPNVDAHTTIVQNSVSQDYDVDVSGSSVTYYGLNQAVPTETSLKTLVKSGVSPYTTQITPDIKTPEDNGTNGSYTRIFTLTEGVTKYRVYMWIEGQDIDCDNSATGSNIAFNVQLSTDSSAPGTSGSSSSSSASGG